MPQRLLYLILCLLFAPVSALASLEYQKPSEEILQLVDVKRAPHGMMDEAQENMVLIYRDNYKSIDELSAKELRLGGLRIDPKTNMGSRATLYNDMKIRRIKSQDTVAVKGLPNKPKLSNFSWSPDQRHLAVLHKAPKGVELWVIDIASAKATRLTKAIVNANLGNAINWLSDSKSLLVKAVPKNRKPLINTNAATPTGPTISVSEGKKAQNRTYQDLLKNKNDEFNFEQLARSELLKVKLSGKKEKWLDAAMFGSISVSPDGEYVLVTEYKKPFSYLVQYKRFPSRVSVYTKAAKKVKDIVSVPLIEDLPKGFMATREGRRNIQWRTDLPSTLFFAEALDAGDPAKKVDYRDELKQLEAPFSGTPSTLMKTINRFSRVIWADKTHAIVQDYWWNNRNTKTYWFNPSNPEQAPVVVHDRNYQDAYSDPGRFVTERNQFARHVLALRDGNVYLQGKGYTEEGQFPFIDQLNLTSQKTKRLYQSPYTDKLESLRSFKVDKGRLTVSIESKNEYPNRYFRDIKSGKLTQITDFENPFEALKDVSKEVIQYKREDGLPLTGTLYLPTDYEAGKRYPMILWAYPREYKDQSSASQNTQNPNEFTYPYWAKPHLLGHKRLCCPGRCRFSDCRRRR